MAGTLGEILRETRKKRGWTLREVEEKTGIHNAHLSQIESGAIAKPAPNILFTLASAYGLSYDRLLKLAGHFQDKSQAQRSLQGAALRAIEELTPEEQREALEFMQKLAHQRMASG
jgi:HTH-type transcriptional regulator, competence development regulator